MYKRLGDLQEQIDKDVEWMDSQTYGGEEVHGNVDEILLAYAPKEVQEAYHRLYEKGGFWYA